MIYTLQSWTNNKCDMRKHLLDGSVSVKTETEKPRQKQRKKERNEENLIIQ